MAASENQQFAYAKTKAQISCAVFIFLSFFTKLSFYSTDGETEEERNFVDRGAVDQTGIDRGSIEDKERTPGPHKINNNTISNNNNISSSSSGISTNASNRSNSVKEDLLNNKGK